MDNVLNVPEVFGCDVFNEATMKDRLPEEVFSAWKYCVTTVSQLSPDTVIALPSTGIHSNGLYAKIEKSAIRILPIFDLIVKVGNIPDG